MKKIPLTQGRFAIVDDTDFWALALHKWCLMGGQGYGRNIEYATRTDYSKGKRNKKVIRMHRVILGLNGKEMCDHVNGNGLDNRRSNLRICNRAQNRINTKNNRNNTSGFKGVSKYGSKWVARIGINFERVKLGVFETRNEAAKVYQEACVGVFGDFSPKSTES
mgnify:CR=1 FL=1